MKLVLAMTALALVLSATQVAAEPPSEGPPAGAKCLFGYNPDSTSNVCTTSTGGSPGETRNTGMYGVTTNPFCVIGNTCVPVPGTTYDPDGGVDYPYPGSPGTPGLYVEVAGSPVLPYTDGENSRCQAAAGHWACADSGSEDEQGDCGVVVDGNAFVWGETYEGSGGRQCNIVHVGLLAVDTCELADPQ